MKADENKTKFTVIVAVWNGASTLQRCIDSVLAQSYSSIELIVVDGGSSDGTVELLQKNEQNLTYWESMSDRGIYHAWNKALKHIQGEWVYFMGADDYFWDSSVVEKVHRFIRGATNIPLVIYGEVNVVDASDYVLGRYGQEWSVAKKHFFQLMTLPHQGIFHHRDIFFKHGEFDERYKIAGDYEFLLRELIDGEAVKIQDLIVAGMQDGGVSSNPDFTLRALKEIGDGSKRHGVTGMRLYWRLAYFRAWVRSVINQYLGQNVAGFLTACYRKVKRYTL